MYYNEGHEKIVKERGDNYKYIGSYKYKEITIDNKNKKHNLGYIRVKCPHCESEYDVTLENFKKGTKCTNCCHSYENSFAYYIQVELGESLNKYWDWKKNDINPYCVYKSTAKVKIWIKCTETNYHGSYKISPNKFHQNRRCPYCVSKKIHPKDSFGRWLIDTHGEDAIEKYWSNKNTVNPFEISIRSAKKVWILCQEKDYHNNDGGYLISCDAFYTGNRCSYCANQKVHPKDSFGILFPKKAKYWSPKNKKSSYEVASHSNKKYKFICEKCGDEFERNLSKLNRNDTGVICKNCHSSQLEQLTKEVLDKYNIKYYREYVFDNLIGVGNKSLRFDFYLPGYNITIECQGIQHKEIQTNWQTEEQFEILQIHDKRKEEYCERNNIELIKIWYYNIDNIEEILIHRLNLNKNN